MGCGARIAVFNAGGELAGHTRQGVTGTVSRWIKKSESKAQDTLELIKLPRRTVKKSDRKSGRSGSFSCKTDIVGQQVIIYCTNDDKEFLTAFLGFAEQVSHKGAREFVLIAEQKLSKKEFESLTNRQS